MKNGDLSSVGWTLILWDIENVPVPDQLRNPPGIKQLKTALKDKFAKSRALQLHCIKLACRWPDHSSPYADLLGWLTTLGDVEALGYQWQGQKDKSHNADRLLKPAADRFMHMLESYNGPEHLVVFITSDQDFSEKIQELQRRNFKASKGGPKQEQSCAKEGKSNSLNSKATASQQSKMCGQVQASSDAAPSAPQQDIQAVQKLLDAISDRFSSDAHEFTRVVAEACLVDGLRSCSRGFQLLPVSCCKIGAAVKRKCPDLPGKLITNLQQQKCQRYFMLIPGPPGTQPAVLLVLTAILSKPYSKAVAKVMNKMYSSSEHPSSGKQPFSGSDSASEGSQDSNASDLMDMLQVPADVLTLHLHVALSNTDQEFVQAVASTCLVKGLMKTNTGYRLDAVPSTLIGTELKETHGGFTGKLLTNLRSQECQRYFRLIDGSPGTQPGVLANLSALVQKPHHADIVRILKKVEVNAVHPGLL
ncbi:MAG: hypothetical protein FRX49_08937 [Trebouxia sp. A1-2]|nr:MAG: hypothetical protein FRX49_08937 [Trebouxia sp. A1-2]